MTASGYDPTNGHPLFDDSDAPDVKLDPQIASQYAGYVGGRIRDTAANRGTYTFVHTGLEWFETDTGDTYRYISGGWKLWHRPWTAYTPTLTNFSAGAGTVVGRYMVLYGSVEFKVDVILGTGFGTTGAFYVSVPITAATSILTVGTFIALGTARHVGAVGFDTSNRVWMLRPDNNFISQTTWTWAIGNRISLVGSYLLP